MPVQKDEAEDEVGRDELKSIREEVQLEIARAREAADRAAAAAAAAAAERQDDVDGVGVLAHVAWEPVPPRGVSRALVTAESGGNRWRREATPTQKAAARVLRTMSRPTREELAQREARRARRKEEEDDDLELDDAEGASSGSASFKQRYYGFEWAMRAVRAALASVHESVRPKLVAWCAFELAESGLQSRAEDLVRMTRQLQFKSAAGTAYPLLRRAIDAGSSDWQRIFTEVYVPFRPIAEKEPPRELRELLAKACAMEGDFARAEKAAGDALSLARALLDAAGQLAVLGVFGGKAGQERPAEACLQRLRALKLPPELEEQLAEEWARRFFAAFPRASAAARVGAALAKAGRAHPAVARAAWAGAAARAWGAPCADARLADLRPLWASPLRTPGAPPAAPLAAALLRCPDAPPGLRAEARAAFCESLAGPTSARLAAAALREYALGASPAELLQLHAAASAAAGPGLRALAELEREWSEALLLDMGLAPEARRAALEEARAACGHGAGSKEDPFSQALWALKRRAVTEAEEWVSAAAAAAAARAAEGEAAAAEAASEVRAVLALATLAARASAEPALFLRVSGFHMAAAGLPPALRLGPWAAGRCAALLAPMDPVAATLRRLAALETGTPLEAGAADEAEGAEEAGVEEEGEEEEELEPELEPQPRRGRRGRRQQTSPFAMASFAGAAAADMARLGRPAEALEVLRWARARGYRAPEASAGAVARALAAAGRPAEALLARAACA